MPNFINGKLLEQNETETKQGLGTIARRQTLFFGLCPNDYWTRDAFNEVSSTLSENLVPALTKLTQKHNELKSHGLVKPDKHPRSKMKPKQSKLSETQPNFQQSGNYRFNNP